MSRIRGLSKSWKESFERPLPDIIEDFGGFSFMEDCVTVHSEDVVDSTDAIRGGEQILFADPDKAVRVHA